MKDYPTPNTLADLERALLHYANGHELPAENICEIMNAASHLEAIFHETMQAASDAVRRHRGTPHIDAMNAAHQALPAGRCLTALHNLAHAERIRALELTLSAFANVNK